MAKEQVNAETNLGKTRQTRTPKDYAAIERGAAELPLKDKVMLRNNLTLQIETELKSLEENFRAAKELINGK